MRRNAVVAKIFQIMAYVELNASGISRMHSEMHQAALPPPRIIEEVAPEIVRVVFQRPIVGVVFQRPKAAPFLAPPLPAYYVHRPETNHIKQNLLARHGRPGQLVSAVIGLGGIGKSTLAAALAHDPEVRELFPDGILWATLGTDPPLLDLLSTWIKALGDDVFLAADLSSASGRLRQLLWERSMLLVVDDAWDSHHVEPFRVGGPHCGLLITTRRLDIVYELGADFYELEPLSVDQAVQLLTARIGRPLEHGEKELAQRLAEVVGCLPLALEVAAASLARGANWNRLIQAVEREDGALEALERPARRRKGEARLQASLNRSLRVLLAEDEAAWRCFVWLGVLAKDAVLTAAMASTLWDTTEDETEEVLEYLRGEALLISTGVVRVAGRDRRGFLVHDLLHAYARWLLTAPNQPARPDDLPGLGLTSSEAHRQLLERYRGRTAERQWATLPDDGYIHAHLVWHMDQAGMIAELIESLRGAVTLPPVLLVDLARRGFWSVEQALTSAREAPLRQKAEALVALAPLVSGEERSLVAAEAFQAARVAGDEDFLAAAAVSLAPLLPAGELAKALEAIRALDNGEARSRALSALAPYLPSELG